ncbi:PQQ-binding-like beta-propeller repeat protein [Mucilaginibacter rubeus]|uniref:FlgD Ig-like domain-containing protein n=1 Tax=Mucilaginibacter rubeus TaxID=2027860 RepID=A0A5C1HYT0_9SPHI|nr:PQQ-binding-like beta-propeller repeat protein [Mucilaginibacter rubeus]QEM10713.1 hypothetical protein DEO27_011995 [Mucilaginibacter rubeus]
MKKNSTCRCLVTLFTASIFILIAQRSFAQASFTFKLDGTAKTSAGVYTKDGTLVRTLWSGVTYNAGTQQYNWDGLNDDGVAVANDAYVAKVLSNNVRYKWEGVIGNTSDLFSGSSVHHAIERMYGMAISGNNAYFAVGYNEQNGSSFRFSTSTPQKKIAILGKGLSAKYVATDGVNVYWAANDAAVVNNWMVFGTKVAGDAEVSFTKGKTQGTKYGRSYKSVIDLLNNDKSEISGLAVQKRGKYLFVAHKKLNELHVLDKTTGALVQRQSFDSPLGITADDAGHIWLIYSKNSKRIIEKFTVGADGKLASLHILPASLLYPMASAVSPDGKTLVVADGGDSQQLKAYKADNGSLLWTYGTAGGYKTDPNVRNEKFYFNEAKGPGTFIAFQPDGSFWVEDAGNLRAQHFAADRKFIDRIMYLQTSYSSFVDGNDPTRVFSDYLEFKVDYSKPLAPNNGSWQLVRNWGYGIPSEYDDKYNRLRGVATLSNGRTYAVLQQRVSSLISWKVVELPKTGPLRITGANFPNDNTQLYPDGSLRKVSTFRAGVPTVFTKKELVKFAANNDPVWGPESIIAQTQPALPADPGFRGDNTLLRSGEITSSGIVTVFDGTIADSWHLGGIKVGGNKLLWRTAMSTIKEYSGPFPANGDFDIGNHTNNAGCVGIANGRSVFWGYHGEFWKNSQVNKWTQVYDNGLFVGQFGTTGPETANVEAAAEMAGNGFSASVVKLPNGDTYLYHNDESVHGGVHRWKIDGLSTIKEQIIPIDLTAKALVAEKPVTSSAIQLMEKLPFNSVLENNKYGWTRNPARDDNTSKYTQWWTVHTNVKTYRKINPDIYIEYSQQNKQAILNRDFNQQSNLFSWTLSGIIDFTQSCVNVGPSYTFDEKNGVHLQVLDKNKKVIAKVFLISAYYRGDVSLVVNGTAIYTFKYDSLMSLTDNWQPITLKMANGRLQIAYANNKSFEIKGLNNADIKSPASIKLVCSSLTKKGNYSLGLDAWKFEKKWP